MSTRERRQIATQKLASWGVPVSLGADRETLSGMFQFSGRVVAPVTANNIRRAGFVVHGADQLRFTDPPLSTLGAFAFLDVEDVPALEKKIQSALERRMMSVVVQDSRLKDLRVMTAIDPERLVALATVSVGHSKVDLEVDPDGVHVVRVLPPKSAALEVPRSFPVVPVETFTSQSDLDLYLSSVLPQAVSLASAAQRHEMDEATDTFDAGSGTLEPLAPPRGVPNLAQLLARFGDHAVAPRVELVSMYQVGKKKFRLVAHYESGTMFKGRLMDADDPDPRGLWSGDIDLSKGESVDAIVASVIGVEATANKPAPKRGGPASGDGTFETASTTGPPQVLPRPGEVWVMRVVVERDEATRIRYVCIDADERPYGEPRVLPRADFFHVFSRAQDGAFRLCVLVEDVRGDRVAYRQMDASRVPGGERVVIPVSHLAAAFVPEASLY